MDEMKEETRDGNVIEPHRLAVKPARAAVLLDCSRSKLYDAINRGEIRAIRIGGMLRIPLSEIQRLLATGDSGRDS